jgi:hypothetical protein
MHTRFWLEGRKGRYRFEHLSVHWRIISVKNKRPLGMRKHRHNNIKRDLKELGEGGGVWTGLVWLWIGTGGGIL